MEFSIFMIKTKSIDAYSNFIHKIIISGKVEINNSRKFIFFEKDINKNWPKQLPKGIIHGDLFIDNIFFKKNKISGIIDFYFAANDYFMYEIAICINALCFDYKKRKFQMNIIKNY